VKEFFVQACPPGGREKDNRKVIVNRKEKIRKRSRFQRQRTFPDSGFVSRDSFLSEFLVGDHGLNGGV
jgi:hypothetical protein